MSAVIEGRARAAALPERAVGLRFNIAWSRLLKLAGAAIVLAIGAYAVLADQVAIATDNAVISAYSVALRTPIEGLVDLSSLHVGDRIERGASLASVANSRVDDQRLVDLRGHLCEQEANLAALKTERQSLGTLLESLRARSQAYTSATAGRLAGSVAEARNMLAALYDRRADAKRVLNRRSELAQSGVASAADVEKAQSDFDAVSHEAEAQRGRLDSLLAQAVAINDGVVSEPGSNDVAYSRQRADEVVIHLSDLDRQIAQTTAEIEVTNARLKSEQVRIDKLAAASMVAPTSGMIWKLEASAGERVGVGEQIAQIVDCDSQFVLATVPQSRVPNIEVGGEAEFRLSGEATRRSGRVVSVAGDANGADRNLAAIPFAEKGQTATVRIALDPGDRQCLVGRTARVLIRSTGPGLFSRLFNRFM